MATKKAAAKSATTKTEMSKRTATPSSTRTAAERERAAENVGMEGATTDAELAAAVEQKQGKVLTSTSSGPLAVPVSEATGAGADQAKTARRDPEHARPTVKGGTVSPQVEGTGSGDSKAAGADSSLEEFFASAEIGTTISKTGHGFVLTRPIGGGATRSFHGLSTKEALRQADDFMSGSARPIKNLGRNEESDEE